MQGYSFGDASIWDYFVRKYAADRENFAGGASIYDLKEWYDGLDREQVKAMIEFAARSLDKESNFAASMLILFDQPTPVPMHLTWKVTSFVLRGNKGGTGQTMATYWSQWKQRGSISCFQGNEEATQRSLACNAQSPEYPTYTTPAMRTRWLGVLVVAATCVCPALCGQTGFVHAKGTELVDGAGQPLMLRGTNLGNWLEPEGYMFHLGDSAQSPSEIDRFSQELIGPESADAFWKAWRENYITEKDLDRIAAMGFNSVRVPMSWKLFDGDGAEGFRFVDRLVTWAKKDHLYVILDLHCAPGGQTGMNIDDSDGYPWLYLDAGAQKKTIDIWRRIALHYSANSTVLGYDLLNEPVPNYPALLRYNKDLEPLYKRIGAAVREVDKNHVLILGGAQWDSNFKIFEKPWDGNVMYTFHKYWMPTDVSVIREYLEFRDKWHVPIWLGESGENNDAWIAAFVKTLEENQVGWCFWPYKKMDAGSSVVTFDRPAGWDAVIALSKMASGTANAEKRIAARPSPENAQAAFDDLLKKITFENERVNAGYVVALGRKSQ